MNLVISNSAQIAFAVSRALNCSDRNENGVAWSFLLHGQPKLV